MMTQIFIYSYRKAFRMYYKATEEGHPIKKISKAKHKQYIQKNSILYSNFTCKKSKIIQGKI